MARLRIHNFSVSLDGYGAGPGQDADHPLGVGGEQLHGWHLPAEAYRKAFDAEGGYDELDAVAAGQLAAWEYNIGATIMGRNMFGPVRGEWPDESWQGWWGPEPPYHNDVFVLTHHARDPIPMEGGTTFHFVTDGIDSALRQAVDAAGDRDVLLAGGVSTLQQYLRAGLVDEINLAIIPVLLGRGERLFEDLGDVADRYRRAGLAASTQSWHVQFTRV